MSNHGSAADNRAELKQLIELTDISADCGPLADIPLSQQIPLPPPFSLV